MSRIAALIALALLVLPGCSRVGDGLVVWAKSHAAPLLKDELSTLLLARGFRVVSQAESLHVLYMRRGSGLDALDASFEWYRSDYRITIGKMGGREFLREEIAIIDECAEWLSSHAEIIRCGAVSRSVITDESRAKFYAKIKRA